MPSGTEFFDQWPRIRSLAALTWHTRKWERTPASGSAHPQVGAHTRKWGRTLSLRDCGLSRNVNHKWEVLMTVAQLYRQLAMCK